LIETDVERYSDPQSFAREVNLPLLGVARLDPVPSGADVSRLLAVQAPPELAAVVDGLAETRQSLTLRSLLLAGFPDDRECFAAGLAIAREWSRRGLKVAVVDLDFWHPTIVRPRPSPNEGLVDALEYGCSFRRLAWEIVANGLWLVGPGSHPPTEDRLVDHPDWERVTRGFAAHADVTLYVAPLLDRQGFVGRLSKRMDGVLLAASVERVGRPELRDAFLELWGSDAPIIGCLGIVPMNAPVPTTARASAPAATEEPAAEPADHARVSSASAVMVPGPEAPAMAALPAPPPPVAAHAAHPPVHSPAPAPAPEAPISAPAFQSELADDAELTAVLDREIRFEEPAPRRRPRSKAGLWAGLTLGLVVAASLLVVVLRQPTLPSSGTREETLPAGDEPVLPPAPAPSLGAGVGGAPSPRPPASDVPQAPAPAAPSAAASGSETGTGIPPSASSAEKPFTVHVASFKGEAKVQGIVRKLRLLGAESWYEPAGDAPGYYRVFVGHFSTEAEAKAHARWLLDNGWVERAHAYPSTER
jgi:hypothetical protein